MLKKSQRLTTAEVSLVMNKGLFAQSPLFTARYVVKPAEKGAAQSGKSSGGPKFSVVAPQKIFKSAVKRNLMRRRVYEALAPISGVAKRASDKKLAGVAMIEKEVVATLVVLICKEKAANADLKTLKADLQALISKIGVL
jgi:ribonuclease P protein component